MRYMLLVYSSEAQWTDNERQRCLDDSRQLCQELEAKGQFVAASPLHPVSTATNVRVRDGKRMITDGPFAETTEQLGGYFLIDVVDLDEAIEIAGRIPAARKGTVEIRPLAELPGLPAQHHEPDRGRQALTR